MKHIPTSINIQESFIEDFLNFGDFLLKEKKIIFVCSTRETSAKFSAILNSKNYDSYSLKDRIINWQKSGKKFISNLQNEL